MTNLEEPQPVRHTGDDNRSPFNDVDTVQLMSDSEKNMLPKSETKRRKGCLPNLAPKKSKNINGTTRCKISSNTEPTLQLPNNNEPISHKAKESTRKFHFRLTNLWPSPRKTKKKVTENEDFVKMDSPITLEPNPTTLQSTSVVDSSTTAKSDCTNWHSETAESKNSACHPSLHSTSLCTDDDIPRITKVSTPSDQQASYSQLAAAVEHCDKRLERLYGRLIWLRNSSDLSSNFSENNPVKSCTVPFSSEAKLKVALLSGLTGRPIVDKKNPLISIEKQITRISERLCQLKSQFESFAYLSWLGLVDAPPTSKMTVVGRSCPPPNPQLHLIRRSDSTCQATITEYNRLRESPVEDRARLSLRETTFNNWSWSDAWLIRFVRQMFFDLDLIEIFGIPTVRLDVWLCDVYRRYNRVPFHNYKHAFMVTQMAYALMWSANLKQCLTPEDQLIMLLSAICHDLDHPGFNNAYQINAGTELAIRYNDQSPLENHHSAMAFDILSNPEANPISHLDKETYRRIRDGIIRCILATDMSRHNDILSKFNEVLLVDLEASQSIDPDTNRPMWSVDKTKLDLVMMILLKICDISNEARPLNVSEAWINRLLAEFFNQSDYEKLVGLPVAPFMDRDHVTKAASQCGFIRFVLLPLYEAAARLIPQLKDVIVKPVIFQLDYYTELQKEADRNDKIDTSIDECEKNCASDEPAGDKT